MTPRISRYALKKAFVTAILSLALSFGVSCHRTVDPKTRIPQLKIALAGISTELGNPNEDHASPIPQARFTQFSVNDVPLIRDIMLDSGNPFGMRRNALIVFVNIGKEEDIYPALRNYLESAAPKTGSEKQDELSGLVKFTMTWLYRKQRDDKWLQPMRSVFNNASCGSACRGSIIAILSETDSKQNIPFFRDILRAHRSEEELSGAVYGLANSGDDSSINDLEMMVGYLFDTEIKRGHLGSYILAVRGLESLAARGNEAATAILRKSAAKLCQCRPSDYPYLANNSSFLFQSFGRLGGAGNIHFLEQLQEKPCINEQAKQLAQLILITIQ